MLGSAQAQVVRVAWNKTWDVLPLIVAEKNGYWRSRGLDVKYVEINGSPQGVQAIHAGETDAAVISPVTLITAREKGFAIVGIAALNGRSDPPQNTYLARTDIKSIADLKGKKIGMSNYGGDFEITLTALLNSVGLDIKRDVTTLIIPLAAVAKAIESGQIDAGASIPTLTTIALKQYPGKIHLLAGTNDIPEVQKLENFQTLILAMSTKFTKDQRPVGVRFAQGYLEALAFIRQKPKEALATWADFSGNRIIAEWSAPPQYPSDGQITQGGVEFQIAYLTKLGHVKQPVRAADIVDRTLLTDAAKK